MNHFKTKCYGKPVDNVSHEYGGLKVLGCPVGTDLYTDQMLTELFQSMNTSISKVKKLSPQFAIPILRYCVAPIIFPPTRGDRLSKEAASSTSKKPNTPMIAAKRNRGKGKQGLKKPKST